MAISGLSVVGRDKYGAFPLKGKVMNVKDASTEQIMKNAEITNMKKILGLETGKVYKDTKSLRYGKVMIMTDQDHDGSHIKGLVMNVFCVLTKQIYVYFSGSNDISMPVPSSCSAITASHCFNFSPSKRSNGGP